MPYQPVGNLDQRGGRGRGSPTLTISEYESHKVSLVRFNVAFINLVRGEWRYIRFLMDEDRRRFAFEKADKEGPDVRCLSTSNTVGGKSLVRYLREHGFMGNVYEIHEDEEAGVFYIEAQEQEVAVNG